MHSMNDLVALNNRMEKGSTDDQVRSGVELRLVGICTASISKQNSDFMTGWPASAFLERDAGGAIVLGPSEVMIMIDLLGSVV
ncbi:uncharacterized protein N7469_003476 [Penicillium citrinum]|uniref:Uncharacterized protein n=2 Tax=Penicillium TaxID=5073 RepID=A0A9W9TQA0_PENCI|nr:uncharacterized protein N7469_003476 [Penicillium citrinum]KAJ5234308.1 hypothetical protein N7469_003476 [Penicillium citrinum]KAJ5589917.1 hypothetical protein N7450_003889 [Penicillium hetheringtonii]